MKTIDNAQALSAATPTGEGEGPTDAEIEAAYYSPNVKPDVKWGMFECGYRAGHIAALARPQQGGERDEVVAENRRLRSALERARNVLGNMAMEHEVGWRSIFARWPIHHEPLRSDARHLLPVIDAALTASYLGEEEEPVDLC